MKKVVGTVVAVGMIAALGLVSGCNWEEGDDFNTSQGAGANVNFTGVYTGRSGGDLVSADGSNNGVTRLVLTQTGDSIECRDNNNSYYTGRVGSPGVVARADADTGAYPAGAEMLQSQINFSGMNVNTKREMTFSGIIRAIAVAEVTSVDRTLTINDAELSQTSQYTYTITESNTRYVLEGNWVEGNNVYYLSGEARGAAGTFTTTP